MPREEKIKIIQKESIELQSISTYSFANNGESSSSTENPSEPPTTVESSFGLYDTNQPVEENVHTPGPSSRLEEIPDSIGQSCNPPERSERMKIFKKNKIKQFKKSVRWEEQAFPTVPEEIELQAVPPENVGSSDISREQPSIGSFGPTHNEEIINSENESPVEENRNNRRNSIQHRMDQMRNCFSFIQKYYTPIIALLSISAILIAVTILMVNVISSLRQDSYIVPRAPIERPPISLGYEKYRLPRSVKPIHYNLKICPILRDYDDRDKFTGEVLIDFEILETCQNITLHSYHLTIESVQLGNNETNLEQLFSYDILTDKQFLIIYPNKTLTKMDKFVLKIEFNGYFNKNLVGLYRSSYNYDGEVRSAILTQMQPIHARKVFPCFDEPGLQATFQITICHKAHTRALSNMPYRYLSRIFNITGHNYVYTEFEKSPVMSTYLVAFAVVDYKGVIQHNISIYSERSQNETNMLELAEKSKELFVYFNHLFDYKYKHPKITFITSNDLHNCGMEPWGLITLRTDVVYRDKDDTTTYQQEIKNVLIANEIAHQWFGNLITPEWWSHLWLKEGYSTYMSYFANARLYQDDISIEFIKLKQDTLRKDSMENTRAISMEVYAPDDIVNNIHFVVYQKAASIIMMMNNFLTTENHIRGLRRLFREKSYQTITPNDLYKNLALEADIRLEDLISVMDSWINQIGFPLVTVSRHPNNMIMVTQEKFCFTKLSNTITDRDGPLWYIPLTYISEGQDPNEENKILWMTPTRSQFYHLLSNKNKWFIFNSDQVGFYRVNYAPNEWRQITKHLHKENDFHNIAPVNRALLIDDSLELARSGYVNYTIPFELLTYLKYENDYFPWTRAISNLKYVDIMLMRSRDYYKFKTFMQVIVRNIFKHISSIKPKTSRNLKMQTEIYEWACHVDLYECVSHSAIYMNLWITSIETSDRHVSTNPIPINLRSTVYCSAIRHGLDSTWKLLWTEYQNEKSAVEKDKILYGLSCSNTYHIIREHLSTVLQGVLIDRKNYYKIIHDVSQHPIGFNAALSIVTDPMHHIPPETENIENLLKHSQITSKCNTEVDLVMVEKMTSYYDIKPANLKPFINEVNNNILWMKNNYRNIVNWLEEKYSSYF